MIDQTKRPCTTNLLGIPRVSNILKSIKLKNVNSQIKKLEDKNNELSKENQEYKDLLEKLTKEYENKLKNNNEMQEKIILLKKLKNELDQEINRTSNKSSNLDLFSTDD